jgi:serine/threonine-protein kinase mTOR
VWLERRTAYTRATGVMSMVGYLLGLGDRHPSNLMLDRYSGKLLHIDFGDCFEASMHREKFPEKVRGIPSMQPLLPVDAKLRG